MTGNDIRNARAILGRKWGLDRPLHAAELGRLLGLKGDRPGETVLDWESGKPVSGPVAGMLWYMLNTKIKPPTFDEAIRN